MNAREVDLEWKESSLSEHSDRRLRRGETASSLSLRTTADILLRGESKGGPFAWRPVMIFSESAALDVDVAGDCDCDCDCGSGIAFRGFITAPYKDSFLDMYYNIHNLFTPSTLHQGL